MKNKVRVSLWLLDNGADPARTTMEGPFEGLTELHLAAALGNKAIVQRMLGMKGVNPRAVWKAQNASVYWFALKGWPESGLSGGVREVAVLLKPFRVGAKDKAEALPADLKHPALNFNLAGKIALSLCATGLLMFVAFFLLFVGLHASYVTSRWTEAVSVPCDIVSFETGEEAQSGMRRLAHGCYSALPGGGIVTDARVALDEATREEWAFVGCTRSVEAGIDLASQYSNYTAPACIEWPSRGYVELVSSDLASPKWFNSIYFLMLLCMGLVTMSTCAQSFLHVR